MSIFKTKTETEMPVASPHLIGGQSPEHDKENNPVTSSSQEPGHDGGRAMGLTQGYHYPIGWPSFTPGAPPVYNSQNLAWPSTEIYDDFWRSPSAYENPYPQQFTAATQTSKPVHTGADQPTKRDVESEEDDVKWAEMRCRVKELRHELSRTKHQLAESQLKAMKSNKDVRDEVDVLSQSLGEALLVVDVYKSVYIHLKKAEVSTNKIRELVQ